MLCGEKMPFLWICVSCWCSARLIKLWALTGVMGFLLGLPPKEKPGEIKFKKFGISLNLGQRGTQLFVGWFYGKSFRTK